MKRGSIPRSKLLAPAVAAFTIFVALVPTTAFGWKVYNTNTGVDTVTVRSAPNSSGAALYAIYLGATGIKSTGETQAGWSSFSNSNVTWLYVNDGRGWGWAFDEGWSSWGQWYDTFYPTGAVTAVPGVAPAAPGNGAYQTARRPAVTWSAWDDEGNALDGMDLHVWRASGGDVVYGGVGNVRSWTPGSDLASGLYYWNVRAHSWINGWGGWFSAQSFFVDYTAPTTSSNAKLGYGGPASVTLSAADDTGGSGVAHTYYKLDSGAQTEGTSVSASSVGAHTLEYWSTDRAGNAGAHVTKSFVVYAQADSTPPHTSASVASSYPGTATITLRPADNAGGCGVAKTYYTIDGGVTREGTSIKVAGLGSHAVKYWSVDNLGNIETKHAPTVNIVRPKAYTPSVSRTTVTHGSTPLTVSGYISCKYPVGSSVIRVREYYRSSTSKSWTYKKTLTLSVRSTTSTGKSYYKFTGSLPTRGYWRFKVCTVADDTHYATSYSSYSSSVHAY